MCVLAPCRTTRPLRPEDPGLTIATPVGPQPSTTPLVVSDTCTVGPVVPAPARPPATVARFGFEGTGLPAGTVALFGHAFAPGTLWEGEGLLLRRANTDAPLRVQMNTLSRWGNGSVRSALLAAELPGLGEGATLTVQLRRSETHVGPRTDLSFAAALAGRSVTIRTWAPGNTETPLWSYDPLAALGTDRWHQGPLALSSRVETAVPPAAVQNTAGTVGRITSLRLIVDVIVTSDGILEVDVCFSNDRVMHPGGGIARFGYTIEIDGRMVYDQRPAEGAACELLQYSQWIRRRGRGADGTVYGVATHRPLFRPDFDQLVRSGVQLDIDRSQTIDVGTHRRDIRDVYAAGAAVPADPYHHWGLARYAGASGGRQEIGYRTLANTLWLTTGDRDAQLLAQRQFEAAATRPMYYYDWERGSWITPFNWPKLTIHSRSSSPAGTPRVAAMGLPPGQRPTHNSTDHITIDMAHHGSFNWTPALLSGRRLCYDSLVARVAWSIIQADIRANGGWAWDEGTHWRDLRPSYETGNGLAEKPHILQARSYAWAMRDAVDAGAIVPDVHPQQGLCRRIPEAMVNAWDALLPIFESRCGTALGYPLMHDGKMGVSLFQESFFYYSMVALARLKAAGLDLGGPRFEAALNRLVKCRAGAATHPDFNYRNVLAGFWIALSEQRSRSGRFARSWAEAQAYTAGWREGSIAPGDMDTAWSNTAHWTGGDWQRNVAMTMALSQDVLAVLEPEVAAAAADAMVLFRSERRNRSGNPDLRASEFFGSNYQLNAVCAAGQSWRWDSAPVVRPGQNFIVAASAPAGTVVGVVRTDGPIPRNSGSGRRPETQAFAITTQPAGNPFTISMGGVIQRSATGTLAPGRMALTVQARTYDGEANAGRAHVSAAVPVQVVVRA